MNEFNLFLTEHAIRDLEGIPRELRAQIHQDLRDLESSPFPSAAYIKRLKGFRPTVYRLHSGNYMVLYHILENTITILRIVDRKFLERAIKGLKP